VKKLLKQGRGDEDTVLSKANKEAKDTSVQYRTGKKRSQIEKKCVLPRKVFWRKDTAVEGFTCPREKRICVQVTFCGKGKDPDHVKGMFLTRRERKSWKGKYGVPKRAYLASGGRECGSVAASTKRTELT